MPVAHEGIFTDLCETTYQTIQDQILAIYTELFYNGRSSLTWDLKHLHYQMWLQQIQQSVVLSVSVSKNKGHWDYFCEPLPKQDHLGRPALNLVHPTTVRRGRSKSSQAVLHKKMSSGFAYKIFLAGEDQLILNRVRNSEVMMNTLCAFVLSNIPQWH